MKKKKMDKMEVGQFWWTADSLYRIDAITPDGRANKLKVIHSPTPGFAGRELTYSANRTFGWSSSNFDRLDQFRTEVYKQRNEKED